MNARALCLAALPLLTFAATSVAADGGMARVGPGTYRPFYPTSAEKASVPMPAFLLDRLPVTRAEYESFVRANPRWQRGKVPRLFADDGYLTSWAGPADAGAAPPQNEGTPAAAGSIQR